MTALFCIFPTFVLINFNTLAFLSGKHLQLNSIHKTGGHAVVSRPNYVRAVMRSCLLNDPCIPKVSRRHASSLVLNAAEREWLQVEESEQPPVAVKTECMRDRFDWRLRAPSRARNQPARPPRGYIKRHLPQSDDVLMDRPFYEAIEAYKAKFWPLLEAEQKEEEEVLKSRLSSWTVDRLAEQGYCLTGVSAYWLQATQFGRPVAYFSLGPGVVLPEHHFQNGTQVLISRIDPLQEVPLRGSVISSDNTSIRISFLERCNIDDGLWRLDVGICNFIYERMRAAMVRLNYDLDLQEPQFVDNEQQMILQGTHLRDVFLRAFNPQHLHLPRPLQAPDDVEYPSHQKLDHGDIVLRGKSAYEQMGAFKDDMRIQSWARRYAEIDPLVIDSDPDLSALNKTQIRALAMMIGQRISLIQGPPGTGKTKTIIEAVKLLKVHFEVPHPILVCTYTNVAVDNLVEGLGAAGVKPLRVGFGERVRPSLLTHTLDYQLQVHPLQTVLSPIVKEEKRLNERINELSVKLTKVRDTACDGDKEQKTLENLKKKKASLDRQISAVRKRKYAVEQEMLQDILRKADVICTTCVSSACAALNAVDFPVVFLDEASMSTEPASVIPLTKGSRHVALIGDHKQLPPVIQSEVAKAGRLDVSLFERLTEEGIVPSLMLDVQYRMHPGISRFPSTEFYNLSLIDGTIDTYGNVHPHLSPPNSQHLRENERTGSRPSVIFLDHIGVESIKDRSRVNHHEAHIVASIVEDLLMNNPQLHGIDIGVIAPYAAQVSLLTRLLKKDSKYKARFLEVLGDFRAMQLANVEVKTVDGFEGREKEVIIFSTVRNNMGGHIGFLADRRRLNVGLTRAKRGLFVVGSISTLMAGGRAVSGNVKMGKGSGSWRRYAEYLTHQGLVVRLSGETLSRALYGNLQAVRGI